MRTAQRTTDGDNQVRTMQPRSADSRTRSIRCLVLQLPASHAQKKRCISCSGAAYARETVPVDGPNLQDRLYLVEFVREWRRLRGLTLLLISTHVGIHSQSRLKVSPNGLAVENENR